MAEDLSEELNPHFRYSSGYKLLIQGHLQCPRETKEEYITKAL